MIYWIEHAPNPWVRAIAIVIIGTIAYFDYTSGENLGPWLGGYGVCNDDPYDNTTPEVAGTSKTFELFRALHREHGPIGGALAFQTATRALGLDVTHEELVAFHQRHYKAKGKKQD